MMIALECQPITEKQPPSFSKWTASQISPQNSPRYKFSAMAACILFPHVPASPSLTLQHLELVIEAVDGAEAELPGLLVLVV